MLALNAIFKHRKFVAFFEMLILARIHFYFIGLLLLPNMRLCSKCQVIKVDHDAHGVDTPEDVEKMEAIMREKNIE